MKAARFLLICLVSAAILAAPSASAQSGSLRALGIDAGYIRTFFNMNLNAPDDAPTGEMIMIIHLTQTDLVSTNFRLVTQTFADGMLGDGNDATLTPIDGLGDEAWAAVSHNGIADDGQPIAFVMALDDAFLYGAITINSTDQQMNRDVITFMMDAPLPTRELQFDQGGESTGSYFDMMPTVDDINGMSDMRPLMDTDVGDL